MNMYISPGIYSGLCSVHNAHGAAIRNDLSRLSQHQRKRDFTFCKTHAHNQKESRSQPCCTDGLSGACVCACVYVCVRASARVCIRIHIYSQMHNSHRG